jgi:CRP-like cAMP-binding protein
MDAMFQDLNAAELDKIKALAEIKTIAKDELVFSEGDAADYIYFIESGRVSIFIKKFSATEEISILGPGEYFGEMAFFSKDKRAASVKALEDTVVLSVDKSSFLDLVKTDREFGKRINDILAKRSAELTLKENLVDTTGVNGKHLRLAIKGDPSLRESAFSRERYESAVDKVLPELAAGLEELLVNRSVYQAVVHFNSSEVHVFTVFDPFSEEIHPAEKIADESYVARHFPSIPFAEKTAMIRRIYSSIGADPCFKALSESGQTTFGRQYEAWDAVTPEEIHNTVSKLPVLRTIPNFYLRNFQVSATRDAIRMQFNCDGTHIVSAEDYQSFLEENLDV